VDASLDVVAVGNALVDVLSLEDDEFVERFGLHRGSMQLIDAARGEELYAAMGPAVEVSGGSAANTMAGLASLGARSGFLGRVRDDQLGSVFAHDIRAAGVVFPSEPATTGQPTGRCLIIVTPDGERTMNTLLGASSELGPDDVQSDFVTSAAITYLEGYLFDREIAGEAFHKAADAAHAAGGKVALTLSDAFCVERFLEPFRTLVADQIDVLFGNADELRLLFGADDVTSAMAQAEAHCETVAITCGAEGALLSSGGQRVQVPAAPVEQVVDTTGAGDLFAAGFLYGLTQHLDLERCGRIGALAAAEVISHVGARPETPLRDLATAAGLL
jgi:sugar/nucleoside kinase (ribokinase family)